MCWNLHELLPAMGFPAQAIGSIGFYHWDDSRPGGPVLLVRNDGVLEVLT